MAKNSSASRFAGGRSAASFGLPVIVAAAVVALVLGIVVGHFLIGGNRLSASFSGQTTVSESGLDDVMATYTYDGETGTVTVRDAIESQVSLDSVKNDDGTYTIPSADDALSVARNRILAKVAEDKGITVSDDELSDYAEQMTGESDLATVASNYGLTEDQATEIVRESAVMYKLKSEVVTTDAGTKPTAPDTPADGDSSTANATYGAYVVGLLGDEWDSANNTWARTDGPYYAAMSGETFSADSATYAQAQEAYYVAYQQYTTNSQTASSEWTTYVNQILSGATIQLATLGA